MYARHGYQLFKLEISTKHKQNPDAQFKYFLYSFRYCSQSGCTKIYRMQKFVIYNEAY